MSGHIAAAVYAATEQHRHECEVRYVASLPYPARVAYLTGPKGVAEIRGRDAAQQIIEGLKGLAGRKDGQPAGA